MISIEMSTDIQCIHNLSIGLVIKKTFYDKPWGVTNDDTGDGIGTNDPGEWICSCWGGAGDPPVSSVAGDGVPI